MTATGCGSAADPYVFTVFFPFGGIGGSALGFQQATAEWRGVHARFRLLGGVDVDSLACQDFEYLTGVPETQLDLFSLADYVAWHGHEPPADWREATPEDIRAAAGGERPDLVATSPPCKGLSALLPAKSAASAKYQALNRLAVRGIRLTLEAWPDDPPPLMMLENVPRIATSRGAHLLAEIKGVLRDHGYVVTPDNEEVHDLGEWGGLSQHRRRYLLVARQPDACPPVLLQPPKERVRSIGEALGALPLPGDPSAGPLHRVPRLQWLTWVRLALIPAGGDWRDLQRPGVENYRIEPTGCEPFNHVHRVTAWDGEAGAVTSSRDQAVADPRVPADADQYAHTYRVVPYTEPAGTVTGAMSPANGAACVAAPLGHEPRMGAWQVALWDEPAGTVTASAQAPGRSNGIAAVGDPRVPTRGATFKGSPGLMGVVPWDGAAPAVTGSASVTGSNMAAAVADPRLPGHPGRHEAKMRVEDWRAPSHTVTGSDRVGSGAPSVADPRWHHGALGVRPWNEPAATVTTGCGPSTGRQSVADPRLRCQPHNGAMGVAAWDAPAPTVTAAGDVHTQGAAAVADPRLPSDNKSGVWVIEALDGTWHRPLTTLDLATLQGFPATVGGEPLVLAGHSQARWREAIGNAIPVHAARAMGRAMLLPLIQARMGVTFNFRAPDRRVWVRPLRRVYRWLQRRRGAAA